MYVIAVLIFNNKIRGTEEVWVFIRVTRDTENRRYLERQLDTFKSHKEIIKRENIKKD